MSSDTPHNQAPDTSTRFQKMDEARQLRHNNWTVNHTYTKFIKFFRKFMVIVALILILAVALWLGYYKDEKAVAPEPEKEMSTEAALVQAQFDGVDNQGRPFRVTAERTVQQSDNSDVFNLTLPMADIVDQNNRWMAASANAGQYNQASTVLYLEENVKLFYDDGMEFTLEKAEINMSDNTANSDAPVRGQGPSGRINAAGLNISGSGDKIIFDGPATMKLRTAGEK